MATAISMMAYVTNNNTVGIGKTLLKLQNALILRAYWLNLTLTRCDITWWVVFKTTVSFAVRQIAAPLQTNSFYFLNHVLI